jgi:hypothetical protein
MPMTKKVSGLNQSTKFRANELEFLMQVVEDIKPIGKVEWDRVTTRYNAKFKARPRIMRNLRNRFTSRLERLSGTELQQGTTLSSRLVLGL